MNSDIAMTHRP